MNVFDMLVTIDADAAALDLAVEAGVAELPVKWNSRLRTVAGRCHFYGVTGDMAATHIELSEKLRIEGPAAIKSTFLHELAHAIANSLYNSRGHGAPFVRVSKRIGDNGRKFHTYATMERKRMPLKPVAHCDPCDRTFKRKRSLSRKHIYRCPSCRTELRRLC